MAPLEAREREGKGREGKERFCICMFVLSILLCIHLLQVRRVRSVLSSMLMIEWLNIIRIKSHQD
jgi:hypothetical protein